MKKIMIYIFICSAVCVFIACRRPMASERPAVSTSVSVTETEVAPLIVRRVDGPEITRYRFYSFCDLRNAVTADSVRFYFVDTGTLAGVEYMRNEKRTDRWIRSIHYFRTGEVQRVNFFYKNDFSVGDTLQISWHPNGVKSRVTIALENGINLPFMEYRFFPTGILLSKGAFKLFRENNVTVSYGLWRFYDEDGKLIKTENFIYPPNERPYVVETRFHSNGNIKSIKMFMADPLDESGEERPIGIWRYYDENGRLIKTEKFENGELIKTKWH